MEQSYMEVAGNRVNLSPGMQASTEIKIKQRRLIQFFRSPLIKYTSEGMKER
jgi:hemolysin D